MKKVFLVLSLAMMASCAHYGKSSCSTESSCKAKSSCSAKKDCSMKSCPKDQAKSCSKCS